MVEVAIYIGRGIVDEVVREEEEGDSPCGWGEVSWQKESVYASIKVSITRSSNCQTVIDAMSTLKLMPPRPPPLLAMPKRLFENIEEYCVKVL